MPWHDRTVLIGVFLPIASSNPHHSLGMAQLHNHQHFAERERVSDLSKVTHSSPHPSMQRSPKHGLLSFRLSSQEQRLSVGDPPAWQVEILSIILRIFWTCSTRNYFSTFAEFQSHNRYYPRHRWSQAFGPEILRNRQAWQIWEMRGMHLVEMGSGKGHSW